MRIRFAIFALLLSAASMACGQSSSPSTAPSPTPNTPTCTFALSTGATINGYPTGGSFTEAVTTQSGCSWTASSQAPWIHVPSGAGGSGTGTFAFTLDPNTGAARSGTLTVAGEIIVVDQTAPAGSPQPACTYALSIGATINGYPSGGTFPVAVTTTPATGCAWTAASNATWIHVPTGAAGSGSGTFTFVVDANTGAARSGTLTAAGEIVVFDQSAGGSH